MSARQTARTGERPADHCLEDGAELPRPGGLTDDEFFAAIYDTLRARAGRLLVRERDADSVTPTGLVHDAFVRLARHRRLWDDPDQYVGAAVRTMRRLLVERARKRTRQRARVGWPTRLEAQILACEDSEIDLLELDEALTRFAAYAPRAAAIVELRFFGDVRLDAAAELLEISARTAESDWQFARIWLHAELAEI